jgi:hypothetical protein
LTAIKGFRVAERVIEEYEKETALDSAKVKAKL